MPVTKTTKRAEATAVKYHNSVKVESNRLLPVDFSGNAFTSVGGGSYYPFFAPDDNLFRYLLELRLLSPTQNNCIVDKTFYSTGDGLQVTDNPFPKDFDRIINGKNQRMDDVLKAVFESFWQDGNKFIEIVCVTVGGEKYVHAYPHNNMDCRLEVRKDGEDPTHVIRSKEFRKDGVYTYGEDKKPLTIPIWSDNPLNEEEIWLIDPKNSNVKRTMLHIKNEVQGVDNYGLPSNFAGIANALLEYEVARFNTDNFKNNMFLAGLLSITGQLAPAESKALLADIRKTHIGRGKQQRIFVTSSEQGLSDTKFTPFTQTHEGHFVDFDKHNENKIISSSNWSKDLMDLKETSGMGKGGAYLAQLFKIKFRTVISPAQQIILNNFIFPFMKIVDEFKGTKFYDLPWSIKPVIPVSLEGTLDINSLLTVDEGRAEIGKGELDSDKGKMLISEIAAKKNPATDPATDEETTSVKTKKKAA